ncbi:MAG: glycoside hydrolase family 3 C-terminal domain-containing protein [Crocinitomicaceae bacterium]|nr:glycoside hydrolase family 3 C-terminal domain-containing protein [Crocinitomicaceae bacterium]MBP6032099.1 glycoside hydrolase family 3 C-terminal domain-containing protein [Crocinitomicaceae bacterium]
MKLRLILLFLSYTWTFSAQIYKDPSQGTALRVQDLLSRMTWEEKCYQLFMVPGDTNLLRGQLSKGIFGLQVSAQAAGDAAGQGLHYQTTHPATVQLERLNTIQKYCIEQTRLGIPMLPFDEALHGLVRNGATAFPQAIALAATWDTELVHQAALHIAFETKQRGIRQILSPVINLASDVRWGRTEETYGEDPFLSAKMGLAFMGAFEENGIITTPKHFIANVGDGGRDSYPIHLSNWYLERTHLIPFERAIKEAGSRSIMTSYNSLNGQACSSNQWLLTEKLKKEWGFKGFVISDANAVGGELVLHRTANSYVESGVHAINSGLDVIFQTDIAHFPLFFPEYPPKGMDTNRINDAVSRVLTAKFDLGLFEHPYAQQQLNLDSLLTAGHQLAQKVAEESIVLLKNQQSVLPLNQEMESIAVFGEDAVLGRLGGYSGPGFHVTSILDGIRAAFPNSAISYEQGSTLKDTSIQIVPANNIHHNGNIGFFASYFDNPNLEGEAFFQRRDERIDFHWTLYGPHVDLSPNFYSVRWNGAYTPTRSEKITLGLEGNDGYRLFINEVLVIDRWEKQSYHQDLTDYSFKKGKSYDLRIEFKETQGNGLIKFIWKREDENAKKAQLQRIVKQSKNASANIVVVGIEEGEFNDRASLRLSEAQEQLIHTVAKNGKKTIVLLVGGSAVNMESWIDEVDGILVVWYPGEAGGTAVAKVLNGAVNPSGKLPITYPMNEAQLPLVYNHLPTGRGDDYRNQSGEPLFPFGFGLSYTTFEYREISVEQNRVYQLGDTINIRMKLSNTGEKQGCEIVQCYLKPLYSNESRPVQELIQFQRVTLNPKEEKELDLRFLLNEQFSTFGIAPGKYALQIGRSSKDIQLMIPIQIH